jgi:hypothetical protein
MATPGKCGKCGRSVRRRLPDGTIPRLCSECHRRHEVRGRALQTLRDAGFDAPDDITDEEFMRLEAIDYARRY